MMGAMAGHGSRAAIGTAAAAVALVLAVTAPSAAGKQCCPTICDVSAARCECLALDKLRNVDESYECECCVDASIEGANIVPEGAVYETFEAPLGEFRPGEVRFTDPGDFPAPFPVDPEGTIGVLGMLAEIVDADTGEAVPLDEAYNHHAVVFNNYYYYD